MGHPETNCIRRCRGACEREQAPAKARAAQPGGTRRAGRPWKEKSMGYPSDLLSSRAVVKPGMYAIIPPEGRVFNVIPGIEGCRMTILCTPKMGAGFVQHICL